jgi:glutaredoxin-like protein NrdH
MNENTLVIFTQPTCGPCHRAMEYMDANGIPYKAFDIRENDLALRTIQELGYMRTPVFLAPDGEHWSGVSREKLDQYKA